MGHWESSPTRDSFFHSLLRARFILRHATVINNLQSVQVVQVTSSDQNARKLKWKSRDNPRPNTLTHWGNEQPLFYTTLGFERECRCQRQTVQHVMIIATRQGSKWANQPFPDARKEKESSHHHQCSWRKQGAANNKNPEINGLENGKRKWIDKPRAWLFQKTNEFEKLSASPIIRKEKIWVWKWEMIRSKWKSPRNRFYHLMLINLKISMRWVAVVFLFSFFDWRNDRKPE